MLHNNNLRQRMPFRRIWTQTQDKTLKYLRQDLNIQRWSLIAEKLQNQYGIIGRNQKQCRQRYYNHLDSSLKLGKLTDHQEKQLFYLHNQLGNKWAEIAKHFQGRTDSSLKNIFHSKLRKAIRKLNRYAKDKFNSVAKTYPLNIVCKIMERSDPKLKVQSDQFSMNTEFFKELQNGLIEYAGSNVISPHFEGWTQRKVFQHLNSMLSKIQNFKNLQETYQNQSVSDQSEYVPLKQRKNSQVRKNIPRIKGEQNKALSEIQKQNNSDAQIKTLEQAESQQIGQINELTTLKKKNSFSTQYTEGELLDNKNKNFSFQIGFVESQQIYDNQKMMSILEEINLDYKLNQLKCLNDSSEIKYFEIQNQQSHESQQLFNSMIDEDIKDPFVF